MSYRLGVDVGGTFTDLLLIDENSGATFTAKVPSTPDDPSVAVLNGVRRICQQSGIEAAQIGRVMHGTTVATNAILTGSGARVGLVVTKGYHQVLQIARSFVPGGLGGWVTFVRKPLLAPLELTIEADERISARGEIITPLDEAALIASLQRLAKKNIQALTISFINAYQQGVHERRARDLAAEIFSGVPISISSEIVPEIQEYERTETTVVNSYVRPIVGRYINNLQRDLERETGTLKLSVLRSDGGLAATRSAVAKPVHLLLSGPAGGVNGALWFASRAGFDNVLTFDMGGTSTDVALVQNARPQIRRETRVADIAVRAPSIDVRTVGAGGGSIAFVPELTKALRVGPESAGAQPGPAAYGKGGTAATVCDANVVLGYLPAESLLGGQMTIDHGLAKKAVADVAEAMGIDLMAAAEGIVKIANETMFGALRLVSVEQGYDPRDFVLVGFGGAGPLHANALGKLLGSWPVVIPPGPGVLCAYGDATTRVQNEAAKTLVRRFDGFSTAEFLSVIDELHHSAVQEISDDGIAADQQEVIYQADVRYHGQAFQITIDFTAAQIKARGLELLREEFDKQHEQMFTFALQLEHELVMLRAVASAVAATVRDQGSKTAVVDGNAVLRQSRYYYEGDWHDAPVYDRNRLGEGQHIPGPAIIVEMDSTIVVLPDCTADIDGLGNLLINPVDA